ncbi:MAG: transcription-repair coupling factor [Flavobacteriales bacterium]|nr:transcription-repair coupling factor [Flavobacteriales bacterium]
MNTRDLLDLYGQSARFGELLESVQPEKCTVRLEGGMTGFYTLLAALLFRESDSSVYFLVENEEDARYARQDLLHFLGKEAVYYLPSSFRKPFQVETPAAINVQERSEVLLYLQRIEGKHLLILTPESLAEKVIEEERLRKSSFELKTGETLDIGFLLEMLQEYAFEREDFVYEPGQFSLRGGIIDIFSFAHEYPFRVELDGRMIESIRSFDPVSQLSIEEVRYTSVVPNILEDEISGEKVSLFNYLDKNGIFFSPKWSAFTDSIQRAESESTATEVFEKLQVIRQKLSHRRLIQAGSGIKGEPDRIISFRLSPQQVFGKQFELLIEHLAQLNREAYRVLILSESNKQVERLESIFRDLNAQVKFFPIYHGLQEGFLDKEHKLAVYTEHQIFGRHYQFAVKKRYSKNQALTIQELRHLKQGDFVVHIDHGVGVFDGLQKIDMGGRMQEAVRLKYKNGDLLYVNIGALHKVSRYTGKEGFEPQLNKLGSDAWQNLKRKTKKKVKDIARDLIKLYAQRKAKPGFQFSPDNYMQVELEASFLYEDTPDQSKASDDVKADMETPHPMDRLVCGDVGFGKTEVAIRAAFKAVCDNKQVAVLVPTTILAQQHYHTFRSRLEGFPVTVDYINRFRTTKQQNATIKALKEGKVDIVIGTHKLLNQKIEFKDLGLMVIDEEQKFGVSAKEKLKQLRVNVDSLTLTATPIPRTLHFSLMGARDLSIINTPPPNRQPIRTELHVFDREILKKAVQEELQRDGQVFIVHNRVRDIYDLAATVEELCPDARVAVGHGQMKGDELENVMLRFIEHEFDVLVATTIIESGLDIPNANTIIINNAHYFGLSDLHQMRGRVGRSNRKAYCYLFCPPLYTLTEDARRRLQAIEEFSELGSGFNVAMRDLDIRGAGNLLGSEQSGFISEIGFDMYHKILDEAIHELRETEFPDLFDEPPAEHDCQVDTDLDARIPDDYVQNMSERLNLYASMAQKNTEEELQEFLAQLEDRFGPLPEQVQELADSMRIKWFGKHSGLVRIKIKSGKMAGYFPPETDQAYYTSERFGNIIKRINEHPGLFSLQQKQSQLILLMQTTGDTHAALLDQLRLLDV